MSIEAPQIQCYLYADLDGMRSIQLTDSGGGPITLTLGSTQSVSDALDDWQTQANDPGSGLNGTYTFEWLPAVQRVSFLCSEAFTLVLDGSLRHAFGFAAASMSGDSSYTSDETPEAVTNPINVDYEPPWPAEETERSQYRWGRISNQVHYHAELTRLSVLIDGAIWDQLEGGPLLTGRAIYYPCGYTSGAYSKANLRGSLDVYPYEWADSRPMGNQGSDVEITTIAGVAG